MQQQWFFATLADTTPQGPVSVEELRRMLDGGAIDADARVWTDGMADWEPASSFPEFAVGGSPLPVVTEPTLGYQSPPVQQRFQYAGFWIRFLAWVIDIILLSAASWIMYFIGGGLFPFFSGVVSSMSEPLSALARLASWLSPWLYYALMESSPFQATVGKLAVGIIVTDGTGGRIGFGRATGRYFAKYLSTLTLLIGYMMAGWTMRKQALHDLVASTLVIHGERRPRQK